MKAMRLDVLLVERKLAESRAQAQRLIMAGQVRVDGQVVLKPAVLAPLEAHLQVERGPLYVSRGGEKLAAALQNFPITIADKVCADVGASTGGFSDCLVQHGARRVYAIDVGKGVLHWKLRKDARVIVMEDTNARYLSSLPEPVQVVTIDVSFISLRIILPVIKGWFKTKEQPVESEPAAPLFADVIALIKPQFEAGRKQTARGDGVIRDPAIHYQVIDGVVQFASQEGYALQGLIRSPLTGPKGNTEFLAWFAYPASAVKPATIDLQAVVSG